MEITFNRVWPENCKFGAKSLSALQRVSYLRCVRLKCPLMRVLTVRKHLGGRDFDFLNHIHKKSKRMIPFNLRIIVILVERDFQCIAPIESIVSWKLDAKRQRMTFLSNHNYLKIVFLLLDRELIVKKVSFELKFWFARWSQLMFFST